MTAPSITTATRGKGRPRSFDRDAVLIRALEVFWKRGYAPASISELCAAMGINAPSLYAAFGNKSRLFLEAVTFYEKHYWSAPARRFMAEKDFYLAVSRFFAEAASILLSANTPCGCMVVLAAVNISEGETDVIETLHQMRVATKDMFAKKIRQAMEDGQLPENTSVEGLATAFNTFLEGMSLQARDYLNEERLREAASYAVRMLPQRRKDRDGGTEEKECHSKA